MTSAFLKSISIFYKILDVPHSNCSAVPRQTMSLSFWPAGVAIKTMGLRFCAWGQNHHSFWGGAPSSRTVASVFSPDELAAQPT